MWYRSVDLPLRCTRKGGEGDEGGEGILKQQTESTYHSFRGSKGNIGLTIDVGMGASGGRHGGGGELMGTAMVCRSS